jgi:hypothetical protein
MEDSSHVLRKVSFQSRSNLGYTILRVQSLALVGQLSCTHPMEIVKKLTNYEAHCFVAPRFSSPNLILCKLDGLGNVQTMKVDRPFLTMLRKSLRRTL